MKRTRNGILIPDVPIMAGGNLPNAVKGVSGGVDPLAGYLVDMGLPSGTLWAISNINIDAPLKLNAYPYGYEASFFSVGNIDGHNSVNRIFDYAFTQANYDLTKGATLPKDTLIPNTAEYDAAIALLGKNWQTPSLDDFSELILNCIYIDANGDEITESNKTTTVNGCNGYFMKSTINGHTLFFPACGTIDNGVQHNNIGSMGIYMTTFKSNQFFFFNTGWMRLTLEPYVGCAVRAVRKIKR